MCAAICVNLGEDSAAISTRGPTRAFQAYEIEYNIYTVWSG